MWQWTQVQEMSRGDKPDSRAEPTSGSQHDGRGQCCESGNHLTKKDQNFLRNLRNNRRRNHGNTKTEREKRVQGRYQS
jgi:hypothetical protein